MCCSKCISCIISRITGNPMQSALFNVNASTVESHEKHISAFQPNPIVPYSGMGRRRCSLLLQWTQAALSCKTYSILCQGLWWEVIVVTTTFLSSIPWKVCRVAHQIFITHVLHILLLLCNGQYVRLWHPLAGRRKITTKEVDISATVRAIRIECNIATDSNGFQLYRFLIGRRVYLKVQPPLFSHNIIWLPLALSQESALHTLV